MRKKLVGTMAAVILSGLCLSTVYAAEWGEDETGYWYQYDDGSYAQGGVKTIDGANYLFDAKGYMMTGWQYISSHWYHYDTTTGAQSVGWKEVDGNWYYFEPDNFGVMHVYWLDLGKNRYYFNERGIMQTGVFYLSDTAAGSTYAYQADENGVLIRNTVRENGNKTIKYDENGVMMYRNNTTRQVSGAEGGSTWQYVLNERDMQSQQEMNQTIILTAAQEKQDALYDEYKSKVYTAKAKSHDKRLGEWEEKVRRELSIFLTAEDIEKYISQVKQGRFCKYRDRDPQRDDEWYDDFYYEYEEEETNTYTEYDEYDEYDEE